MYENAYERVDMIHDDLDETSYIRETNDFAEAIRTGTPPRAGIADGYKTLVISSAALESGRTGAPVRLP